MFIKEKALQALVAHKKKTPQLTQRLYEIKWFKNNTNRNPKRVRIQGSQQTINYSQFTAVLCAITTCSKMRPVSWYFGDEGRHHLYLSVSRNAMLGTVGGRGGL